MTTRLTLPLLALVALLIAACGGTASPAPTSDPTPTPIVTEVDSPEAAAALVIASDQRFAGSIELSPDIIGASNYWEAEALPDGGYRITQTLGWGDCPAGCISRHVWVFEVSPDGQVELVEESGDDIPPGGVPNN